MLDQTGTLAINLTRHADRLFDYRKNLIRLYDQLKSSAKFFGDIILQQFNDGENEQIKLLLQQIDSMRLEIENEQEASVQLQEETRGQLIFLSSHVQTISFVVCICRARQFALHSRHEYAYGAREYDCASQRVRRAAKGAQDGEHKADDNEHAA